VALGIDPSEKPRFEAPGNICGNSLAVCTCPNGPPQAEDGEKSNFQDGHDMDVACVDGTCQAYVTSFACGARLCDSRTQYCESFTGGIPLPDGGPPATSYSCQPIPAACTTTPRCPCITAGQSGAFCGEEKGRVKVSRLGI
jgi:hypothetical protein